MNKRWAMSKQQERETAIQKMEELSKPLIARGDNVMGIAAVAMILSLVWLGIGFALGWWLG